MAFYTSVNNFSRQNTLEAIIRARLLFSLNACLFVFYGTFSPHSQSEKLRSDTVLVLIFGHLNEMRFDANNFFSNIANYAYSSFVQFMTIHSVSRWSTQSQFKRAAINV